MKNSVDKNIIVNIFNVNEINEINFETINEGNIFDYNENRNEIKNKITEIIDNIRKSKSVFQNLNFIFEGINDQRGKIINHNLIEDNYQREYPFSFEKLYDKVLS